MLSNIIGKLLVIIGDMIMMLMIHMLCSLQVLTVGLREILCLMLLGKCVINLLLSFMLSCKTEKVVARKLGSKCKGDKACIWVPKAIVTNLVGPNKSWVPKTQA
jgi:hypothetical protein